jgi:uncharacterized RDD family membrane protein YckC
VDYALLWSFTVLLFELQPWFKPDETGNYGLGGFLLLLPVFLVWCLYFGFVEARFCATVGKGLFDLAVERTDGKGLRLGDCLRRHLLDPLDLFFPCVPGLVAIIAVKITPGHQRLGDMFAGTRVLLKRQEETSAGS